MARYRRFCLIALALALPVSVSAFAAQGDFTPLKNDAIILQQTFGTPQRCQKAYDTCTNLCDANYTTCSRGRELAVVQKRCTPSLNRCTDQCDRNEKVCAK